jgi:type II secretory pathway pseudopilin PulG
MNRNTQGFALIDLVFVCGIIGLLASIALPRLMLAKSAAGAASAIGSMRAISSAELTFALTCGGGFYAPNLTTLGTVPFGSKEPFIGGGLSGADTVVKSGYIVKVEGTAYAGAPPSCNGLPVGGAAQGFKASADAADAQNPRHFATNANGAIYENTSSLFAVMPETGKPAAGHPLR